MVYVCGHPTQKGAPCKRRVHDENTRCPFHTHSDGECSICLNPLSGRTKTLPCTHTFHSRCISEWTERGKYTCPYCREAYGDPPPQYRVNISVENVASGNTYTQTGTEIPPFVSRMNIITPDTIMTELLLDVTTRESLLELLSDLGIGSIPETV